MHWQPSGLQTVALAIVSTSLSNLPLWLLTGFAPQVVHDLEFGNVGIGAGIATFFGVSALLSIKAGRLIEVIGWQRGMILSAGLSLLSLLGVALVAHSYPVLIALLALGAIGFTVAHPSANLALAGGVAHHRQGVAFGVKQASLPVTTLMVGVAVPVFAQEGGWRWAFVTSAAITFGFLALLLGMLAPVVWRMRQGRRLQALERRGTTNERQKPPRALVILAVGAGLGSAATASLGGFLVVYAVASGLTPSSAGRLLAVASLVCLASRLVTGYVADRRGRRHLPVVSLMMLSGSVGFGLLAVPGSLWLLVTGAILAFGIGWAWNGLYVFAIVHNHRTYPALATGVVQTAIGTGSAGGPLLFGLTVSLLGYSMAWAGAGLALAAGAGMVALGRSFLAKDAR